VKLAEACQQLEGHGFVVTDKVRRTMEYLYGDEDVVIARSREGTAVRLAGVEEARVREAATLPSISIRPYLAQSFPVSCRTARR
jgi:hypothetical protein